MQLNGQILITIIIPTYNSAVYLSRCIESMACQNLSSDNFEVIVINDGSTDDTVLILDTLCSKYSFLRYVTTENRGLSRARNRGIDEAVGEILLFVDSDDSIAPYSLLQIYQEMKKDDLDMMLLNYLHVAVDGSLLDIPFEVDKNTRRVVSGKEFLLADSFLPMVWAYAYKRAFLLKHELKMKPIWHEDEEFTPRSLYFSERVKYYPLLFYFYYQNSNSYMESYNESKLLFMIMAMSSLNLFRKMNVVESDVSGYFNNRIARSMMLLVKNSIRRGYKNQEELFAEMKKGQLLPLHPRKSSFYFLLLNLSPVLFEKYYRFVKRKPKHE